MPTRPSSVTPRPPGVTGSTVSSRTNAKAGQGRLPGHLGLGQAGAAQACQQDKPQGEVARRRGGGDPPATGGEQGGGPVAEAGTAIRRRRQAVADVPAGQATARRAAARGQPRSAKARLCSRRPRPAGHGREQARPVAAAAIRTASPGGRWSRWPAGRGRAGPGGRRRSRFLSPGCRGRSPPVLTTPAGQHRPADAHGQGASRQGVGDRAGAEVDRRCLRSRIDGSTEQITIQEETMLPTAAAATSRACGHVIASMLAHALP